MIKLFYSGTYSKMHCLITPDNVKEMLADDVRSKIVDKIDDVIYASEGVITKNPNVTYIGGFYYETPVDGLSVVESVVNAELSQIDRADCVVVSLLGHAAIGSISELFYAASKGKRIELFIDTNDDAFEVEGEYWFPILTLARLNTNFKLHKVNSTEEIIKFIMELK